MSTVLILGATSDIGQALAYQFASENFNLFLTARKSKNIEPLKRDIEIKYEINVSIFDFDTTDFSSHPDFYHELPHKPDVVISVFGYLGDQQTAQQDFEEAEKIIDTNYTGAVSILNEVANDFEQRKHGTIIGISSVAGERGRQSNYFYGSAKAGFTTYLDGMRNRLYHSGVHVITVKPGFMNTKMTEGMNTPHILTAEPEEAAKSIFKAFKKKKNIVYILWIWKYIMLIIKNVPEFIFKKLKM